LLEAKSSVDLNQSGTQYVAPLIIGQTNDYGAGGAAQYILLIPQYNGTVGEASAGLCGRFTIVRGSNASSNDLLEYDLNTQTAYNVTYINLVPKTNQSYPLNVYSVTYGGTPYLAINGSDLIRSGGLCSYTGYYWNNVNTVKPEIVLASSCTNVSEFQSYTYLAGSVLTANASGYIGIGTANPQSLLAVEGTITAQQVSVTQTGWSDFVFDSMYRCRSLENVEVYTRAYKHLPDIPSAKEIQQNGLDLGGMEKLHMQKIEELTLYAIEADKHAREQDSTIAILQAQLKLQQQEIAELRSAIIHKGQ
jgi:hypothetical protein